LSKVRSGLGQSQKPHLTLGEARFSFGQSNFELCPKIKLSSFSTKVTFLLTKVAWASFKRCFWQKRCDSLTRANQRFRALQILKAQVFIAFS